MDYDGNADDVSSTGGFSDEDKASLVGFGETAGSTVSGPVSSNNTRAPPSRQGLSSPSTPRIGAAPFSQSGQSTPMSGIMPTADSNSDPTYSDGMTYDQSTTDTAMQQPQPVRPSHTLGSGQISGIGREFAESMLRGRLTGAEQNQRPMGTPDGTENLGKFPFE